MGSALCGNNIYEEVKKAHGKELSKYVTFTELKKDINERAAHVQEKVAN